MNSITFVENTQHKYPITFSAHVPTDMFKVVEPCESLFRHLRVKVLSFGVVLGIKFNSTTSIGMTTKVAAVNDNSLLG